MPGLSGGMPNAQAAERQRDLRQALLHTRLDGRCGARAPRKAELASDAGWASQRTRAVNVDKYSAMLKYTRDYNNSPYAARQWYWRARVRYAA